MISPIFPTYHQPCHHLLRISGHLWLRTVPIGLGTQKLEGRRAGDPSARCPMTQKYAIATMLRHDVLHQKPVRSLQTRIFNCVCSPISFKVYPKCHTCFFAFCFNGRSYVWPCQISKLSISSFASAKKSRCWHLDSSLRAEHRGSLAAGSGPEPRESRTHRWADDLLIGLRPGRWMFGGKTDWALGFFGSFFERLATEFAVLNIELDSDLVWRGPSKKNEMVSWCGRYPHNSGEFTCQSGCRYTAVLCKDFRISICLSTYQPLNLSTYVSINPSICQPINLST